jgi:hypothetical protein
MSAIPVFGRLRDKDHKFAASLGYIVNFRPAWATVSQKKPTTIKNVEYQQSKAIRDCHSGPKSKTQLYAVYKQPTFTD